MKKIPDPIDRHVGERVHKLRITGGVSQQKLGEAIGVTFQQIQKYEKGLNRISASRLQQIAAFLGVTVTFFFENAPSSESPCSRTETVTSQCHETNDSVRLINAFEKIESPRLRELIVNFVSALAEDQYAMDERGCARGGCDRS